MITLDHVIEVALLVLTAYVTGCGLGYASHNLLRRFSARRMPAMVVPNARIAPVRQSAARRLARTAERGMAPAQPRNMLSNRPPELPAPRGGVADDLKKIKGIGTKTESSLNDLGIYHFDQIAAWQPAHLEWLDGKIAIKGRISREQWVDQAVLLATALPER